MVLLDEGTVTLTSLDAGKVFAGGRFHSLVPIAQELTDDGFNNYYSVAVIKRNMLQDVLNLHGLRGKKACFPGVGTMAGWILPIYNVRQSSLVYFSLFLLIYMFQVVESRRDGYN